MKKIHAGLTILLKYGDGHICAEHDEIFAGSDKATPETMSKEDLDALEELGWSWHDTDSWHHFV